ncbi:DUF2510 domain-containing protein [Xylanimonas ulmi]|uniref:Uncharacterized protein DUF2510 n=1 Tax=Xylanimonas ulmi TaxID=228973 RepID=A0A4Q7LZB3_9MICO|nr:DUF2510 domain-containing protein [Xylanibacterium ulmi]RZS60121.1 uncharacterized protein DUF2510 [Xylanibacterium ulmi]
MARRGQPYVTVTVRTQKQAERLVRAGWEVVAQSGRESWVWGSDLQITLRRPNPRFRGAAPSSAHSHTGIVVGWFPDQRGEPGVAWYWDGTAWAQRRAKLR